MSCHFNWVIQGTKQLGHLLFYNIKHVSNIYNNATYTFPPSHFIPV